MIVHNATNRKGDLYRYFICIGRKQRTTSCDIKAILIDIVEDKVVDLYRPITLSPTDRQRIEAAVKEQIARNSIDSLEHRKILKSKKDQLERERRQLLQAHYADAIPLELLRTEQERITKALGRIEEELTSLTTDEAGARTNLTQILDLLENCHATYLKLPEHLRRLLNLAVFDSILVDLDEDQEIQLRGELAKPLDSLTTQFHAITRRAEAEKSASSGL